MEIKCEYIKQRKNIMMEIGLKELPKGYRFKLKTKRYDRPILFGMEFVSEERWVLVLQNGAYGLWLEVDNIILAKAPIDEGFEDEVKEKAEKLYNSHIIKELEVRETIRLRKQYKGVVT
jgi:hypothetical protein